MKRLFLIWVVLLQVVSSLAQFGSGPGILEPIIPKNTYQNPTSMIFLGPDDILVGGFQGKIWRTTDGVTTHIQTLPGAFGGEIGFIYLRKHPDFEHNHYVYASFINEDESSQCQVNRYNWDGAKLTSRTKLFDLGSAGDQHVGGPFVFGPPSLPPYEQKIFIVVGDKNRATPTANSDLEPQIDESAMIVRVNQDGSTPVGDERGPFYDAANGDQILERMFAYGIRNSYGLGFDPLTDRLWETENSDYAFDEINLVEPGMNGGWSILRGPLFFHPDITTSTMTYFGDPPVGHYCDPVFSFDELYVKVATAILFYDRDNLGEEYKNQCFVALTGGRWPGIYHFKLNDTRSEFLLDDPAFDDKILGASHTVEPLDQVLFALSQDDGIVDMRIGPDGFIYALCIGTGRILKVAGISTGIEDWVYY